MPQVTKIATAIQPASPPKLNPHYPRWIVRPDGASVIVQNRAQHEAQCGHRVNEDGSRKREATPEEIEFIREVLIDHPETEGGDDAPPESDPAEIEPLGTAADQTPELVKRGPGRPRKNQEVR